MSTVSDLIDIFRREARDKNEPYLWDDDELAEFADDAQMEACRRARLIVDSTTSAICNVTVTANNPVVTIDPRVIFIRRALLVGQPAPLGRGTWREMDARLPGWQDASAGTPQIMVTGLGTLSRTLYPKPIANGTLNLVVVREPLVPLTLKTQTPEIQARYHRSLVYWMLFRSYSKVDSDSMDPQKAAKAEAMFAAEFGPRTSAVEEAWIEEHYQADLLEGVY
jgi:hypothetical protein